MIRTFGILLFTLVVCLAATPLEATNYYVDAATGNDANAGTSPATAFKTIHHGMLTAGNGDTVFVAPGTYNSANGEFFPIIMNSGVRLKSTSGAEVTIIDASDQEIRNRVFVIDGANSSTLLEGFTITGGYRITPNIEDGGGGGIRITGGSQVVIRKNIIGANAIYGFTGGLGAAGGPAYGGGIYSVASAPTIVNNVIAQNGAFGGAGGPASDPTVPLPGGNGGHAFGGGIYSAESTGGVIAHNTLSGNQVNGGMGGIGGAGMWGFAGNATGGGIYGDKDTINSNIFSSNLAMWGFGGFPGIASHGGLYLSSGTPRNNLFFSNTPDHGTTGDAAVLDQDPMFVGAPVDLDLQNGSPATGRGAQSTATGTDFDGYTRPVPPSIGAFEPPDLRMLTAGDFDGDGDEDIVLRHLRTGDLAIWLMNGTAITGGGFVGSPGEYTVAGVGDFDGNGRADLLLRDDLGNIGMWLMNGSTITAGALVGSPGGYGVAAVADFNGDARADILLRDSLGNIGVWFMNGSTIAGGALIGSPGGYSIVGVADFNGDLRADILLRDGSGNIGMWLMNGATITSGALVGSPGGYTVGGAADLSGDGRADIVLRDSAGNLGLWVMNGATITSGAAIGSTGSASARTLGDFNNSGHADFLIQDSAGALGMWFMNGATITASGPVAGPAVSSYEIK